MSLRIDETEVFLEPFFRRRDSNLIDRDRVTINLVCGSVSEDHEHWTFDFAASEVSSHGSGCEECFVDVVVHDYADRKSTRLNSSHRCISYAVFCLKKKTT